MRRKECSLILHSSLLVPQIEPHSTEPVVAWLAVVGSEWHHFVYLLTLAADELSLSAAFVLESRLLRSLNVQPLSAGSDSFPYLVELAFVDHLVLPE